MILAGAPGRPGDHQPRHRRPVEPRLGHPEAGAAGDRVAARPRRKSRPLRREPGDRSPRLADSARVAARVSGRARSLRSAGARQVAPGVHAPSLSSSRPSARPTGAASTAASSCGRSPAPRERSEWTTRFCGPSSRRTPLSTPSPCFEGRTARSSTRAWRTSASSRTGPSASPAPSASCCARVTSSSRAVPIWPPAAGARPPTSRRSSSG